MSMEDLHAFLSQHAIRGDCQCGRCLDAPVTPQQPGGHTADMVFFKVAAKNNPNPDTLKRLIEDNKVGSFCTLDVFDGNEHNYQQLGAWIGDQGEALTLMGLGAVLGLWQLLT